MATQDPKTDPQIEEKEEKEGPSLLSNITQMIILFWSLGSFLTHISEIQLGKLIRPSLLDCCRQ